MLDNVLDGEGRVAQEGEAGRHAFKEQKLGRQRVEEGQEHEDDAEHLLKELEVLLVLDLLPRLLGLLYLLNRLGHHEDGQAEGLADVAGRPVKVANGHLGLSGRELDLQVEHLGHDLVDGVLGVGHGVATLALGDAVEPRTGAAAALLELGGGVLILLAGSLFILVLLVVVNVATAKRARAVAGMAAAADALVARVVKVVKRDPVLGDAKRLVEVFVEAVGVAQCVLHVKGLVKGELVKVKGALLGGVGAVERDGAVKVVDARASVAVAGRRVGRELANHGVDGPAEAFGVVLTDGVVALVGAVVRAQAALKQVAQRVDHVVRRALWRDRSLGGHQGVHVGKVLAEIAGVVVKAAGVSVLLVAEQHEGSLSSPQTARALQKG